MKGIRDLNKSIIFLLFYSMIMLNAKPAGEKKTMNPFVHFSATFRVIVRAHNSSKSR